MSCPIALTARLLRVGTLAPVLTSPVLSYTASTIVYSNAFCTHYLNALHNAVTDGREIPPQLCCALERVLPVELIMHHAVPLPEFNFTLTGRGRDRREITHVSQFLPQVA
jgi:hypothetical protein